MGDAAPEYLMVGGLVFVPLSHPWAELKGKEQHARALIHQHWGRALPEEGRQVIILTKVLAHPCNVGFHSLSNVVLDSFSGSPVNNLAQLAQAVAACESENLVFEFLRPVGDGCKRAAVETQDPVRKLIRKMRYNDTSALATK